MATLGIHIPTTTVDETVGLIRRADELSVGAVWLTSGGFGPDTLTTLAVAGTRTSRIQLGTSIVVAYTRHPLAMAQQSLAISDVAHGRFRLGIGIGHRPTVEGILGLSFGHPGQYLREYIAVLRQAFAGDVEVSGSVFRVTGRLARTQDVPIYVSALRASGYRLAGEVADGAISWATPPAFLRDVALPAMAAAAEQLHRRRPRLVGHAMAIVTTDPDRAAAAGRERLVANTRQRFYQDLFADAGFPEASDGHVPDALAAELSLVGDERTVEAGIRRFLDAGCDELVLSLLPGSADDVDRTLRMLGKYE